MRRGRKNALQLSLGWKSSPAGRESLAPVDRTVLMITYLLLLIGLIMVFSASGVMAETRYGDSMFFLKRQAVWIVLGLLALHWVSRQDYDIWKSMMPIVLCLTIGCLILVLIPDVGSKVNGSRRWFRVAGLSFQPGELAKLTAVLYLASFLVRREEDITSFKKGVLAPVIVVGALAGLALLEPDMGTAMVLVAVLLGLLFLGGARITHLVGLVLSLLPLGYLLIMESDYRRRRLMSFLDPWQDPHDAGFQLTQSFVALGNGGFAGVGLGEGRQKLFFLPEAHADFVLALVGEELGFLGTGLLMVLFAILLVKGFHIAGRAPDAFGRHLASGVTLLLGIQVLINAGVVSGLLPTKGLTLPLVSYGGSSLIVTLIAIGMLLSISREDPASRVGSQ
ncbi:MAG: putative lipid II flippase FtsW [Nitrospinae bacterium]|nr:putative lipid II flippase FtsW [Nitrospinota bacterium]